MKTYLMITILTLLFSTGLNTSKKIELSSVKFNESPERFLQGASTVRKGKLFGRDDMVSYGIEKPNLTYQTVQPSHVELLAHRGVLSGYAFKIYNAPDQDKVISFLKSKYKKLEVETWKWQTTYRFRDEEVTILMRSIAKEKFPEGMNAYLDVKSTDFYNVYEDLRK